MCSQKNGKSASLSLLGIFCLSLLVLAAVAAIKGPFVSVDTGRLLAAGNKFITHLGHGNLERFTTTDLFPNYIISTMALSAVYQYLGLREWGVMALNSLLFSLVVCAIFSIWRSLYPVWNFRVNRNIAIASVGLGMYVLFGLSDVFLWSYAILTDIIFLFWVTAFVFFAVHGFLTKSRLMWAGALLIAVIAPLVRPTGMILPLLYLLALGLFLIPGVKAHLKAVAVASFVLPALLAFVVVPFLVLIEVEDSRIVSNFLPGILYDQFRQAVVFFNSGVIISNRIEVELAGPLTYVDIVTSMIYRLVYYWIPLRIAEHPYSMIHNVVNLTYMIIAIPFLALGVVSLVKKTLAIRSMLLFLAMTAYAYALFHAVTLVSFDWRYQLPAMIPFWIVAGCGVFDVVERLQYRRSYSPRSAYE